MCGVDIAAVPGVQFSGKVADASINGSFARWTEATISWGDGTSTDYVDISNAGGVSGTHTYAASGSYTVTVVGYGEGTGTWSGMTGSATGRGTATVEAATRPFVATAPAVTGDKQVGGR